MEREHSSRTALFTAYSRGYHARNDCPRIFDDFLAHDLLGEERTAIEEELLAAFRLHNPDGAASFADTPSALAWIMQSMATSPIVLGRARYAEEILEKAVQQGGTQYVILGAGLDTFAFRRPDLAGRLRVFEVDHPATQGYKRRRLAELGWENPACLQFVPVDFTKDSLGAELFASGYDRQAPTFFSWLGVSYYLSREVAFATMRSVAEIAPAGSSLVFDYLDFDAFIPAKAALRVQRMLWSVQEMGEPMEAGFDPCGLAAEMVPLGLRLVEDLSPEEIQGRYFMGRADRYRACEHVHFAHAVTE